MLGAIIGDIAGSRFEFASTNDYDFDFFAPNCSFTDDTICTVAVADALLEGLDYGQCMHDWCRRYPYPMGGYGIRFSQWVKSDAPQPYGSFGNGSAMRVSPVAWWFPESEILAEAAKTAACTHSHELGVQGACAVAIAIYDCHQQRKARGGQPLTEADIDAALARAKQYYFGDGPIDLDLEQHRNCFDETCQGTVPVALWIVRHSKGFEDAVRQAVSLGADADTLGAIVGSMAEALWGIPDWMKAKALTYLPEIMQCIVQEFYEKAPNLQQ